MIRFIMALFEKKTTAKKETTETKGTKDQVKHPAAFTLRYE